MIDMRLSPQTRRASGEPSANASSLNYDIIELLAAGNSVAESDLFDTFASQSTILAERLAILARLGFLSVSENADAKKIYQLSKLGQYAHTSTYFAID